MSYVYDPNEEKERKKIWRNELERQMLEQRQMKMKNDDQKFVSQMEQ